MQAFNPQLLRRQFFGALTLITAACLVGSVVAAEPKARATQLGASTTLESARQELLAAAKDGDPDFPDEKNVKLTHLSYVCSLKTKDGPVLVADRRAVVTEMFAPRGLNYITFFDDQLKYLGKYRYARSRPLYCDEGKLYLFGELDGTFLDVKGNVIDATNGYESLKIYWEYAYGSSGGIVDRPDTK